MTTATNSRVTNFIAMIPMLTGIGHLLAFLLPTDCLRSLENWPPFQRALRQSVGNPEAIDRPYDKPRQQPVANYAFNFGSFYNDFLRWTGQTFAGDSFDYLLLRCSAISTKGATHTCDSCCFRNCSNCRCAAADTLIECSPPTP